MLDYLPAIPLAGVGTGTHYGCNSRFMSACSTCRGYKVGLHLHFRCIEALSQNSLQIFLYGRSDHSGSIEMNLVIFPIRKPPRSLPYNGLDEVHLHG